MTDHKATTHQNYAEVEKDCDSQERLSLFRHPIAVVSLFCSGMMFHFTHSGGRFLRHAGVRYVLLPALLLWCGASLLLVSSRAQVAFDALDMNRDGLISQEELQHHVRSSLASGATAPPTPSTPEMNWTGFQLWWREDAAQRESTFLASYGVWREAEFIAADLLFWLILGILSSIGFGTGFHSGMLFLFPYINRLCLTADVCGGTDFWLYPVNPFYGPRGRTFQCLHSSSSSPEAPSNSSLFHRAKIAWIVSIAWGAGTAIGEIPPYLVAFAAASKRRKGDSLLSPTSPSSACGAESGSFLGSMASMTENVVRRYGFFAVLLLSSAPNAAFDLCGVACGHFLMPFTTFFSALLIGKAVFKTLLQSVFFVALFSGNNAEGIALRVGGWVSELLPPRFSLMSWLPGAVGELNRFRQNFANPTAAAQAPTAKWTSWIAFTFECVTYVVLFLFSVSLMEECAMEERRRRQSERTNTTPLLFNEEDCCQQLSPLSDKKHR